jgi:hypothetical protein
MRVSLRFSVVVVVAVAVAMSLCISAGAQTEPCVAGNMAGTIMYGVESCQRQSFLQWNYEIELRTEVG